MPPNQKSKKNNSTSLSGRIGWPLVVLVLGAVFVFGIVILGTIALVFPIGSTKICLAALSQETKVGGNFKSNKDGVVEIGINARTSTGELVREVQRVTFIDCLRIMLGMPIHEPEPIAANDLTTLGSLADTWRGSPGSDNLRVGFPNPDTSWEAYFTLQNFQTIKLSERTRASALDKWCLANAACVECQPSGSFDQRDVRILPGSPVKWTRMPGTYPKPPRNQDGAFEVGEPYYAYDAQGERIYALCDPDNHARDLRKPAKTTVWQ